MLLKLGGGEGDGEARLMLYSLCELKVLIPCIHYAMLCYCISMHIVHPTIKVISVVG